MCLPYSVIIKTTLDNDVYECVTQSDIHTYKISLLCSIQSEKLLQQRTIEMIPERIAFKILFLSGIHFWSLKMVLHFKHNLCWC